MAVGSQSRQISSHAGIKIAQGGRVGYNFDGNRDSYGKCRINRPVVTILVATETCYCEVQATQWDSDKLARSLHSVPNNLAQMILDVGGSFQYEPIDAGSWIGGRYRPTPTIVEAAQALYRGHDVEEISRSEAAAENLTRTVGYVAKAIESAKRNRRKPGSPRRRPGRLLFAGLLPVGADVASIDDGGRLFFHNGAVDCAGSARAHRPVCNATDDAADFLTKTRSLKRPDPVSTAGH